MTGEAAVYIINRDMALKTALQQNRIKLCGLYEVLQICYHDGEPFDNAPPNLVHVPVENFVEFFSSTGMRLPGQFLGEGPEENIKGMLLVKLLEQAKRIRTIKLGCYGKIINKTVPDFTNDRPWRIYMPTSRYTDVWQYCLKNLAKALRKKGCDARVFIEEDDMHDNLMDNYRVFEYAAEFKPHIWFSISQGAFGFLHPDMFHVIWWQDPRPPLGTGPIEWRERDIIFSQYKFVDDLLIQSGAKDVTRQGIGIDLDVYRPMPEVQRKRKVVFVGSSYIMSLKGTCSGYRNNDRVIREIENLLIQGLPVTNETIADLSRRYDIPHNTIYERHMNYVVRERAVEWLCQCKDIEVEVYGRYWENNEIVRPFFKGELPYGEAVAKIYNEATYALSLSAVEINTQRLAEIGACGCIPVVFDCRALAEKPHWQEECLFFKNREELYSCFSRRPSGNPEDIGRAFSYDIFAEKILTMIEERIGVAAK